jgi:hypothetical protein
MDSVMESLFTCQYYFLFYYNLNGYDKNIDCKKYVKHTNTHTNSIVFSHFGIFLYVKPLISERLLLNSKAVTNLNLFDSIFENVNAKEITFSRFISYSIEFAVEHFQI